MTVSAPHATALHHRALPYAAVLLATLAAAVPATLHATPLYAWHVEYPSATNPSTVAVGDLNGDGKADLAVTRSSTISPAVAIQLGNGDGSVGSPVYFPTVSIPDKVSEGDLNGDGLPDVVTTGNGSANQLSVLIATGGGNFASPVAYTTLLNPAWVEIADMNGDGRGDLVVSYRASANVSVMLNAGNGTFLPRVDYPCLNNCQCVAIGDLNGDGRPDVVGSLNTAFEVVALLNTGGGALGAPAAFGTGANSYPGYLALRDFNGDGNLDVAAPCSGTGLVAVLLGAGNGTFGPHVDYPTKPYPNQVIAVDANGDGKLDLITLNVQPTNSVFVLLGDGAGGFTPQAEYGATHNAPAFLASGDLNGDGNPDLVITNYFAATVSVLLNVRAGNAAVGDDAAPGARLAILGIAPNPSRAGATIRYTLPGARRVSAEVLDVAGRRVRTLFARVEHGAGEQQIAWDRRVDAGTNAPAGLYFVRLRAGDAQATGRLLIVE